MKRWITALALIAAFGAGSVLGTALTPEARADDHREYRRDQLMERQARAAEQQADATRDLVRAVERIERKLK